MTLSTNAPKPTTVSAHFVIFRSPSAGRGLGEADVTVRPDWMGLSCGRPFWTGFRPYREARPLHTCGLAKKELLQEDFASDSESPVGRVGEQAFVQPMRKEGTVVHNEGDIKIYQSN